MDLTVYPNSRIARMRRPLRLPALLVRAVVYRDGRDGYAYVGDDLATDHFGPFARDDQFEASYRRLATFWEPAASTDMRWRMWILTRVARQCRGLRGEYAEFGTWRGGCAYMILATAGLPRGTTFHLFDTFAGIPDRGLTPGEAARKFAGRYADGASVEQVRTVLSSWSDQVVVHQGNVFDTVPPHEAGPFAFVHLDLNASAPTRHVLEQVFPNVVAGGIVLLDDYGGPGYEEQRDTVDEFFDSRPEEILALPTGQALVVRR